jgi:hypothetical protein
MRCPMLSATTKNMPNMITSSGFSMCSVNRGGMKMKFHTSALTTPIASTGPRFQRVPASTMASRNTNAENVDPV